jgi:hypothetical protein
MISMTRAVPALLAVLTLAGLPPSGGTPRRASSGDLTKAIEQYSGDELAGFVGRLAYGQGADRARGCRDTPECASGQRTSVRIDAVADADSLGPGSVGPYGTVAARLINRGQGTETRYGMRGGGRQVHVLIVMPGGESWRLEELDQQAGTWSHRTIASGRLNGCNHPFVRGARADFKTCAQATGGATFSLASATQGFDAPMWISCASGCCTAE